MDNQFVDKKELLRRIKDSYRHLDELLSRAVLHDVDANVRTTRDYRKQAATSGSD